MLENIFVGGYSSVEVFRDCMHMFLFVGICFFFIGLSLKQPEINLECEARVLVIECSIEFEVRIIN